jgi:hypothetical protein
MVKSLILWSIWCVFILSTNDMSRTWIELLLWPYYSKNNLGNTSGVYCLFDLCHAMSFCLWWTIAEGQRREVPRKTPLKIIQVGKWSKKGQNKKWLPERRVKTGANGFVGLTGSGNVKKRLREVVEVCMCIQLESSSKYKTTQQQPTVDRELKNRDRENKNMCGYRTIQPVALAARSQV